MSATLTRIVRTSAGRAPHASDFRGEPEEHGVLAFLTSALHCSRRLQAGRSLRQYAHLSGAYSACRSPDLSGGRVGARDERAASKSWPEPDRRYLRARTVKPERRDTPRRVTPALIEFHKKRAHELRAEYYRNMLRAAWALLTRIDGTDIRQTEAPSVFGHSA